MRSAAPLGVVGVDNWADAASAGLMASFSTLDLELTHKFSGKSKAAPWNNTHDSDPAVGWSDASNHLYALLVLFRLPVPFTQWRFGAGSRLEGSTHATDVHPGGYR